MSDLTPEQLAALRCTCTRLDDVWHHERFCPVPVVEQIIAPLIAEVARLRDALEAAEQKSSDLFAVALRSLKHEGRVIDEKRENQRLRDGITALAADMRVEAKRLRGINVLSVALWLETEADRLERLLNRTEGTEGDYADVENCPWDGSEGDEWRCTCGPTERTET